MRESDSKYIFSVIMATYNNVATIGEAIESIVCQTIGMEKIQLILISDGSTDGTDDICQHYVDRFPNNVVYRHKENGGVSSARNMGLDYVEGKYVIFFDGDDAWDRKAFARVAKFFDRHYDEVDLCSCKMEYSGEKEGQSHPLDFKFTDGDRVVDLTESPEFICTTIGNSVFKASAIRDQRFVPGLWLGEDATFNVEALLDTLKCGVISSAVFFYHMDVVRNTASGGARDRESFYLDIPRDYYLRIIKMSLERHGEVLDFIQQTVLYDIRWRLGAFPCVERFTDTQRQQYLQLMHEVLSNISDKNIRNVKGHNEFRKAYLMSIKYGRNLLEDVDSKRGKGGHLYAGEILAFSTSCRGLINIRALQDVDGSILVTGYCRNIIFGKEYQLRVADAAGNNYSITYGEYPDNSSNFYGLVGERLCVRRSFNVRIPAQDGLVLSFSIEMGGFECRPNLRFAGWTGISDQTTSYMVLQNWIITRRKYGFAIRAYSHRDHFLLESRKQVEFAGELKPKQMLFSETTYKIQRLAQSARPKKQVAFVSGRKNDMLEDNLLRVKQALNEIPSVTYTRMWPHTNVDRRRFAKAIYKSKVVVLDDYSYFLRDFDISSDHHVLQLWHACGAFKKFGSDGTSMLPALDGLYHRRYDIVAVSSDNVRAIYAQAFDIPIDRVRALGVPRTDAFFDAAYREQAKSSVFSSLPQLIGKRVILYAPTFRDTPFPRRHFVPDIDFDELSKRLPDDTVFVLRPHPVMTDPVVGKDYKNILEVRDMSTQDLMFVSDLLITDYSSVIFEFSLLGKPMLFYCYDYDEYERDFYLDYEQDLPGRLVMNQEDLFEALSNTQTYKQSPILEEFRDKYMSACDGHSTERVASYIRTLL